MHGLGRRVGRAQVRVLFLERAQLTHLGVVIDVGDRGRIQDVIPVIGLGDLQAEVGVPPPRLGGRRLGSSPIPGPAVSFSPTYDSPPVSSISSASMLAASRQRVNTARACTGDTPASPQAGRDHCLFGARGQRQPQPPPQPDDLGGLPRLAGAISRVAPARRAGPPATPASPTARGPAAGQAARGPRPSAVPGPPPRTGPPHPRSPRRSWPRSKAAPSAPAALMIPNGAEGAQQCTTV